MVEKCGYCKKELVGEYLEFMGFCQECLDRMEHEHEMKLERETERFEELCDEMETVEDIQSWRDSNGY